MRRCQRVRRTPEPALADARHRSPTSHGPAPSDPSSALGQRRAEARKRAPRCGRPTVGRAAPRGGAVGDVVRQRRRAPVPRTLARPPHRGRHDAERRSTGEVAQDDAPRCYGAEVRWLGLLVGIALGGTDRYCIKENILTTKSIDVPFGRGGKGCWEEGMVRIGKWETKHATTALKSF